MAKEVILAVTSSVIGTTGAVTSSVIVTTGAVTSNVIAIIGAVTSNVVITGAVTSNAIVIIGAVTSNVVITGAVTSNAIAKTEETAVVTGVADMVRQALNSRYSCVNFDRRRAAIKHMRLRMIAALIAWNKIKLMQIKMLSLFGCESR